MSNPKPKPRPSGAAIRAYREHHTDKAGRPKSLESFGEPLGVQKAIVSRWENDQVPVPAERAVAIQEEYGIPPGFLRPDLWDPPSEAAYDPAKDYEAEAAA